MPEREGELFLTRVPYSDKPHYCRQPINWFKRQFRAGTIWRCWCGKAWKYGDFGAHEASWHWEREGASDA